ncbi:MAG: hypothetical protein M5T61_12815 [Acidimicrobiia bacterium]|nr:hypothetical protein [Acidimicrobiia bacterium]
MNRHPLDAYSLISGLLFMGLGTWFLLDRLSSVSADITWVPPIVLLALGAAGLISSVATHRDT